MQTFLFNRPFTLECERKVIKTTTEALEKIIDSNLKFPLDWTWSHHYRLCEIFGVEQDRLSQLPDREWEAEARLKEVYNKTLNVLDVSYKISLEESKKTF